MKKNYYKLNEKINVKEIKRYMILIIDFIFSTLKVLLF